MKAKLFEVRDSATFITMLAIKCNPENEEERYLLGRAGFTSRPETQSEYVLMVSIVGGGGREIQDDPYEWGDRTFHVSHKYIGAHFDELKSGDVVDVEFIRGESTTPKVSEHYEEEEEEDDN